MAQGRPPILISRLREAVSLAADESDNASREQSPSPAFRRRNVFSRRLEQLKTLLPPGQAFPREAGTTRHNLLDGMAIELARVDGRVEALPFKANLASTNELLSDWERVAGLPDKCSGVLEETLQRRKNALLTKLISTGGQSPGYFIDLVVSLGYDVTIDKFRPFRAGMSHAGDSPTNGAWVFTWRMHAAETSVISFRARVSAAGERLRKGAMTPSNAK